MRLKGDSKNTQNPLGVEVIGVKVVLFRYLKEEGRGLFGFYVKLIIGFSSVWVLTIIPLIIWFESLNFFVKLITYTIGHTVVLGIIAFIAISLPFWWAMINGFLSAKPIYRVRDINDYSRKGDKSSTLVIMLLSGGLVVGILFILVSVWAFPQQDLSFREAYSRALLLFFPILFGPSVGMSIGLVTIFSFLILRFIVLNVRGDFKKYYSDLFVSSEN